MRIDPDIVREVAELHHGPLTELLDLWQSAAPEMDLPGRQHFGPETMVPILDKVFLIDVLDGGERFRYRLIGTRVAEWSGGDATGQHLDDPACGENRWQFIDLVRTAVRSRQPVVTIGQRAIFDGSAHLFDRMMLPLARDGETIDMVIGVANARLLRGGEGA